MADERETWVRQFLYLALFAAAFHTLQFIASFLLWMRSHSAALISYGFDAAVSATAAFVLARTIQREWRKKFVAYGYMGAAAATLYAGGSMLWNGQRPQASVLGIVVAAVSMLV